MKYLVLHTVADGGKAGMAFCAVYTYVYVVQTLGIIAKNFTQAYS
jgi:hypothetical protein